MQRIPEPELMDEFDQARAYAEADFDQPNAGFVETFARRFPQFDSGSILDLGCGPGDIVLRLAERLPGCSVHGLDGSGAMLQFAADRLFGQPRLQGRVQFVEGRLPRAQLPLTRYDAIVSNSLLHHLHDPGVLWRSIREAGAPGAAVLVMDLFRPASAGIAREIVEAYAGGEPEVLKRDFFNSLCAAFEPGEVRAQLESAGLGSLEVEIASERHLLVSGRLPA